uniref:G-protein coupled receptors family 1 profile domain-containing protein n=1 Tax=Magallana gigas TaxID=29159 RepID=A0A8W8LA44_MAGGI
MDNVTSDVSYKVKEWNHEIAQSLIPNNIILSLYMVAGVLGNSIVIFIYSFKMKGNKEERYFIPFLAMVDLWASLINASFAIAQNMMQASFDNDHLCKAWWFFSAFSTLTSALFLLIIAVHRYLKVCKPLGRQMTRTWKRFAMCMVLTIAFTLSVSLTNFYGSDPFLNEELSIYGHRCSRLESANKTESLVFGGSTTVPQPTCPNTEVVTPTDNNGENFRPKVSSNHRAMDNDTILSDKLDKWNSDLARGLTPNNVILSLYISTGLLGNSTVILIYGFKMNGNKEERYIPFLATADFWASLVCGSFGVALNMMQAQFNSNSLCKAWWFFASYTTFCSIFLLLIIAIHRYLKVCRPLGRQMTLKWKRFAMCMVLVVAFALSGPMTYFYGSVSFPNEKEGIVGLRCSRLKTVNKTGSLIFGGIVVLTVTSVIIFLVCFYARIGYTIITHFKYNQETRKEEGNTIAETPSQFNVLICNSDGVPSETDTGFRSVETNNTELSGDDATTNSEKTNDIVLAANKKNDVKTTSFKSSAMRRKEIENRRVVHKFTLMFMLITVIFLVCYIPKVIIMLLEARNTRFWEEFSDSGRAETFMLMLLSNKKAVSIGVTFFHNFCTL